MAQGVARRVCIKHVHRHVITCLSVCCFLVLSSSSVSRASTFSLTSTCPLSWTSTLMWSRTPSTKPNAHPQNEEYCPVAIHNPLTGYEQNQLDNFDYWETSAAIFQDDSVDIDTEPSYSCDSELDDELIGKTLSSPLHSGARRTSEPETNLSLSWGKFGAISVPFHTHKYGETLIRTKFRFVSKTEIKSRPGKRANQDYPWKQKEQILAEVRSEIQKHELQAESDKRSIQELTGITDSQRMEIDRTFTGCEQSRRDQSLLQEELSERNRALRETRIKSLHEMEELKRVQELRVDEFSRRRLIESQDTINELTARIHELQNEVNCMNDSRDFQEAESVRSGPSYVPSQPAFFPNRDSGGLLSRNNQPPDIENSQGFSGKVFANPRKSSSSLYPGEFNPSISNVTEDTPVLTSTSGTRYMWWTSNSRHSLESEIPDKTVSRKFIRP